MKGKCSPNSQNETSSDHSGAAEGLEMLATACDPMSITAEDIEFHKAVLMSMATFNEDEATHAHETKKMNDWLVQFNLTITTDSSNPWDGDCWFHTVSWHFGVPKTAENAKSYRNAIVEHLIINMNRYREFCVDEKGDTLSEESYLKYCNNMRRKGTYNTILGDSVPMAISELYDVDIIIYDPMFYAGKPLSVGRQGSQSTLLVARIATSNCEHIHGVVNLS